MTDGEHRLSRSTDAMHDEAMLVLDEDKILQIVDSHRLWEPQFAHVVVVDALYRWKTCIADHVRDACRASAARSLCEERAYEVQGLSLRIGKAPVDAGCRNVSIKLLFIK